MSAGFELLPARPQAPLHAPAYQRWLTGDGEVFATFHRREHGFLVRFIDRADFLIAADCASVTCAPVAGIPEDAAHFLYANQIRPLLLGHAGALVLHGSAVTARGEALAFVGQTGRGKSTLAAAFARQGHAFLTDDGVQVEPVQTGWLARPNLPDLRLRQDSMAALLDSGAPTGPPDDEKRRVAASPQLPFQPAALPLRAVYLLGPGDSPRVAITPLARSSAFTALLEHTFLLDTEDRRRMRGHWERLGRFAETIACFTLDYPRRYADMPAVMKAVLDHATAGVSAP